MAPGYQFDHWTSAPGGTGSQNPLALTLNAPATASAYGAVLLSFRSSPPGAGYRVDSVPRTGQIQLARLPGEAMLAEAVSPLER